MRKSIFAIAALAALVSCQSLKEEWQPVFTITPPSPAETKIYQESELPGFGGTFTSIKDLKAMYPGSPKSISGNVWIKGQVISSDVTGNIYRELYIQDETGGIDLKLGKSSLYSEYSLGQWLYVKCDDLIIGAYNGMPQLGAEADKTPTNEYETSYIDLQVIIDQHVFKGKYDSAVTPKVITEAELKESISKGFTGELWGKLVTLEGVVYQNQIFCLFYPNPNLPHKSANPENRVFLSDKGTWGINTWAFSKNKFKEYLLAGNFDEAEVGSGATRFPGSMLKTVREVLTGTAQEGALASFGSDADLTYKQVCLKYATANYVSHYFNHGSTQVQIRTSGYAKFSDTVLSDKVLNGEPVTVTGILTIYNGSAQLSLVDDPSVSVK